MKNIASLLLIPLTFLSTSLSYAANQNSIATEQAPETIAQCDTNGDNEVNIQDVITIINKVLSAEVVNTGIDCNDDGKVSILDVVMLINMVLNPPQTIKLGMLNDTGITWGAGLDANNSTCTGKIIMQQDCAQGRDVTHNDDSDGHAGFSFTKLDDNGNDISASANQWTCVKDNVTGLMWEVKTDDGGLRDKDWTYSWFNSTSINDGRYTGVANGGESCSDVTNCDTEKFVQQVNNQGLCGHSNWRMPTIRELETIISFDRTHPTIDTDYFPNTHSSGLNGKGLSLSVRLVRGGQ